MNLIVSLSTLKTDLRDVTEVSRELTIDGLEGRETEEQRELHIEFPLLLPSTALAIEELS